MAFSRSFRPVMRPVRRMLSAGLCLVLLSCDAPGAEAPEPVAPPATDVAPPLVAIDQVTAGGEAADPPPPATKERRMTPTRPAAAPPPAPVRSPPARPVQPPAPRPVIVPAPTQPPAEVDPVEPYPGDEVPR